jgi:hypothetical protein
MGSATAFARDFSLLFRRHRRKSAAFLPFCRSSVCSVIHGVSTLTVARPASDSAQHKALGPVPKEDPVQARAWVHPWECLASSPAVDSDRGARRRAASFVALPERFATVGLSIKGCATKMPQKGLRRLRKLLISAEILDTPMGLAEGAEVIHYTPDYT